jgi:hypothetical protein
MWWPAKMGWPSTPFFFNRGNFTYPPKVWPLLQISPMFKTSHYDVSKFGFLSFCPFHTENPNGMSILPQNDVSFSERYSF